jgi:hypothetical protein
MPRARQRHSAAAALASVHARRGPSGGKLNAPPLNAAHPSAQQPPPRRGSARSPDRASPSVCAAPRRPTTPTSTRRCAGFPLAVTSSSPGTLAPPRATSRLWAPLTRCHPPTSMGTRDGTSPAFRTQSCSGVFLTPRTTGSAVPTIPAPGVTTPRTNAASSSPTTQQTPPVQWAPATGRSRPPRGSLRAWLQGRAPLLGPTSTRS